MEAVHSINTLIAFLALMSTPVVIVLLVLRHRRDVTAMKLKAVAEFADRGATVPFELLLSAGKPGDSDLRVGTVLTAIGVGAVLFAFTLPRHELWGLGLLPLFAGIGFLISWGLSDRSATLRKDG